jgi:hypothetical protein
MRRFRITRTTDVTESWHVPAAKWPYVTTITAETDQQALAELPLSVRLNATVCATDVGPAGFRGWLKALLLRWARAL